MATSTPPPDPTQHPPMDSTSIENLAVAAKMPTLDYKTALGLAHVTSDPADTLDSGHAIAQIVKTAKTANALSQMPETDQAVIHAQLTSDITKSTGAQLKSVGYQAPMSVDPGLVKKPGTPNPVAPSSEGFFQGVASGFDALRHAGAAAIDGLPEAAINLSSEIAHPIGAVIPSGVRSSAHGVLSAVNDVSSIVPHFIRASILAQDQSDPGAQSRGLIGQLLHPSTWLMSERDPGTFQGFVQDWRATENGAQTFDPAVIRTLNSKYDQQSIEFAKQLAEGGDPTVIAARAPGGINGAVGKGLLQAAKDPRMQQMVTQLQNSRMSFGQDLVGEKMLNDHPAIAHKISGAADGLVDWYANPLVVGGGIIKAAKLARYALDGNDVQAMYYAGKAAGSASAGRGTANVARYMDQAAKVYNNAPAGEKAAHLVQWDSNLAPMLEDLKGAFKNAADQKRDLTGADIARAMSGVQGNLALMGGRAGRYFHGATMVPQLSAIGQALRDGKVLLGKAINWNADIGKITKDLAPGYEAAAQDAADGIPHMTDSAAARLDSRAPSYRPNVAPAAGFRQKALSLPGRTLQSAGRLLPHASYVIDGSPDSARMIRQIASAFLPTHQANKYMDLWVNGTTEQRFTLLKGLVADMGDAAGASENIYVRKFVDSWLNLMENDRGAERYAVGSTDEMKLSGVTAHAGLSEGDMNRAWKIPEWRTFQNEMKKGATMGTLRAGVNNAEDHVLALWKGMLITRPGFALRVSAEELVGSLVRNGLVPTIRSYAARDAIPNAFGAKGMGVLSSLLRAHVEKIMNDGLYREIKAAEDAGLSRVDLNLPSQETQFSHNPWKDYGKILASHVIPEPILKSLQTPAEHIAAWFAYGPRAIEKVGQGAARKIAGEDYLWAMKIFVKYGNGADAFRDFISSVHQGTMGWGDLVDRQVHMVKGGVASSKIEFRPSGRFVQTGNQDELFSQIWAGRLNYLSRQKPDMEAMLALGKVPKDATAAQRLAAQRKAVFEYLKSPEAAELRSMSPRSTQLPDGRLVSTGEITQDQALRDWANRIVTRTNEVILSPKTGLPIPIGKGTILDHVWGGNVDYKTLDRIDKTHIPPAVIGPELMPYHENLGKQILSASMETLVGKPVDILSRQPIFLGNYVRSALEVKRVLASKVFDEALTPEENATNLEKLINDTATERAIRDTLPYIHDIRSRTQFEQAHRRLFPFLFAQRQFYERWIKNFQHSPQAIARMGTIMNGLHVTGFIHNDPQTGNAYFSYPGSQALTEIVQKTLNQFNLPAYLNIPSMFTGEMSALTPGLNSDIPSASPFFTVALDGMASIFPQYSPEAAMISGGVLADSPNAVSNLLDNAESSFLPSIVTRMINALQFTTAGKEEIASNVINAMAYLQAAGHGLSNNATPDEKNLYISRLQTQTTSLMITRAIFGFITPATPTLNQDSLHLDIELKHLLAVLPYDQAISAFIAANPDGFPYTVGKTASPSGAPLPATPKGLTYIQNNLDFLKKYPTAAPWLIPQNTLQGKYDNQAEAEQLLTGLRQYRNPGISQGLVSSWYNELVNARDGQIYYAMEDIYHAALDKPGANSTLITSNWNRISGNYLNSHDQLKQVIAAGLPKQRRTAVIQQMQEVLADKNLPKTPTSEAIKGLMEGWNAYNDKVSEYAPDGNTLSGEGTALYNETVKWNNLAKAYVAAHPEAAPFWTSVLQYSEKY